MVPPGERYRLFTLAYKLFPTSFLVKIIAFLLWTSPLIFNFLENHYGIDSILTRGLLTAAIVGGTPTLIVYLITLARTPGRRKYHEMINSSPPHVAHEAFDARKNSGAAMDRSPEE